MRELEVLGNGHLKLDFADIQDFFEQDLTERVRSAVQQLIATASTSAISSPSSACSAV